MGDTLDEIMNHDLYHRPDICPECGGVMVFRGVGEYKCEDCGYVDYDDYGKVRNYIERYRGANVVQVSDATGVSQKTIRTLLKESRIEIVPGTANHLLSCEMCGKPIRFGRLCNACEASYNRSFEAGLRQNRQKNITGYSTEINKGDSGAKRFTREK